MARAPARVDSAPVALLKLAAAGLAAMVIFRTAVLQFFNVPSASMYPTLEIGDVIAVTKFSYGYSQASLPAGGIGEEASRILGSLPRRGDVVVFRWAMDPSATWVKRVIALPGDTVSVQGGIPTIAALGRTDLIPTPNHAYCGNDECQSFSEILPEAPPHEIQLDSSRPANRSMAPLTVPPGMLFVMGDNRDDSADSRVGQSRGGAGLVSVQSLEGRVRAVLTSPDLVHPAPIPFLPRMRLSRTFLEVR